MYGHDGKAFLHDAVGKEVGLAVCQKVGEMFLQLFSQVAFAHAVDYMLIDKLQHIVLVPYAVDISAFGENVGNTVNFRGDRAGIVI